MGGAENADSTERDGRSLTPDEERVSIEATEKGPDAR